MEQNNQTRQHSREEFAVVLDFLQSGYSSDPRPSHKKTSLAQAIGTTRFSVLELVPKPGVHLEIHQKVYIGDGKRDQIHHILGRLPLERLTPTARAELEIVVKELVKENEPRFVEFINKAPPLTTRMHTLELIPGIGKKHMWEVIEKRDEKPFTSFADLRERVKFLPDLDKSIAKRIIDELEGNEKHNLFVDNRP